MGEETAVAALKAGAHDFLVKGRLARLVPALEREMRDARERHERLQADQALRNSEAAFRSLVEHAVVGIYQATLDGRFLAVNSSLGAHARVPVGEALVAAGLPQSGVIPTSAPTCWRAPTRADGSPEKR